MMPSGELASAVAGGGVSFGVGIGVGRIVARGAVGGVGAAPRSAHDARQATKMNACPAERRI